LRLGRGVVVTVVDHSVQRFDGVALCAGLFATCESPGEILAAQWARLGGGGGCFGWCVNPASVTDPVVASARVLFAMGVVLVHVSSWWWGGSAGPWGPAVPPGVVGWVVLPALLTPSGVRIYSALPGPIPASGSRPTTGVRPRGSAGRLLVGVIAAGPSAAALSSPRPSSAGHERLHRCRVFNVVDRL
jgi:hypothetical protein